MEKAKILSVTGGIPKYLEEMNAKVSAEKNIADLCFSTSGLLYKRAKLKIPSRYSTRYVLIYEGELAILEEDEEM
ncbi:MAG: hypothetical protein HQK49_07660 [Oligoflexia bacterium]|nr:hypothetical protein [Oligoflexia bacterium]